MDPELLLFHERIAPCKTPEDLFGDLTGSGSQERELKNLYRKFALISHVDRYQRLDEQRIAHLAFSKLTDLHAQAEERIAKGIYGTSASIGSKTPPTIRSRRGTYVIQDGKGSGDLSSVYIGTFEDGTPTLLKVSRHSDFNDLLIHEAKTLQYLNTRVADTTSYRQFIPTLLESFDVKIEATTRRVNVFEYSTSGFYSLPEVVSQYPTGVDQRHFVWIFNRLLTTLSFVHGAGIGHGAVLPTHVLIHPTTHAIQLVDWCFSVPIGTPIPAMSNGYSGWYPPEVPGRLPLSPATDIYMAAMCMSYILGADFGVGLADYAVHPRFRHFLESCLIKNAARRPADAWELFEEFGKVAEEVFGKKKYVRLEMV